MIRYALPAAMIVAVSSVAFARDRCCDHCGCQCNCRKICRVVCEKKIIKKPCYECKCEDFCVPGPSCKVCTKCECDCCGCTRRNIWKPGCAEVRSRVKLYKTEIEKEVCEYKWVVEYLCPTCCTHCQPAQADDGATQNRPDTHVQQSSHTSRDDATDTVPGESISSDDGLIQPGSPAVDLQRSARRARSPFRLFN